MVVYVPERIRLSKWPPEVEDTFALALEGSFCKIYYDRQRYWGIEVTNVKGSGEVSPFLTELLWAMSSLASEIVVRADLQSEEEGDTAEGLLEILIRMGEDITLEGPRTGRGYEFSTTARSRETLGLLLAEWPSRFTEYFVIYYVRLDRLHELEEVLRAKKFQHARRDLVRPFLSLAELIVCDQSDRELNSFSLLTRSLLEEAVVRIVAEQCRRFGVQIDRY